MEAIWLRAQLRNYWNCVLMANDLPVNLKSEYFGISLVVSTAVASFMPGSFVKFEPETNWILRANKK